MTCPDENTLLAYCERRLGASEALALESHLDACEDCLALVGEAARGEKSPTVEERPSPRPSTGEPSRLEDVPRRGTVIGRYVVLDRLGAGGMGVVLSAYDPQLDRKVALKLVRAFRDTAHVELEQRLLREAQAVARLSHPQVITVFDVGSVDGRLFMAMEFVEGQTLRQWLKEAPRTWRQVLEAFRQAGQGLAAAHAAQLVHRDFKPDNVLVDARGRVRVTDFGLARLQEAASLPPALPAPDAPPSEEEEDTALTRTGAVMGTPAYMPPEQWRAEEVDARGDQFSFCVALYEALYGRRPFARGRPPDFQRLQPPPPETRVPAWVRRAVLKGLSEAPAERHASMEALLGELAKDPSRLRGRVVAGLALVSSVVALPLFTLGPWARPAPCTGATERVARVWNEARQQKVRAAFQATGSALAAGTADAVARHLADYAQAWAQGSTETCQATHVRHEQPESVLIPRMACLDSRLRSLDLLVNELEHADAALVHKATEASQHLPRLSDCARVESLLSVAPPPEAPEAQARLEDARARLAKAQVLLQTGRYAQGVPEARSALETARALHYRPLEAEALHDLGWLEYRLSRYPEAARSWTEGLRAALAGRHDDVALRCAIELVSITGYELEQFERSLEWAAEARALLERSGPAEEQEAQLENQLGIVHFGQGLLPQAIAHYQRALTLRERLLGPSHLETAKALSNLALVLRWQGQSQDARHQFERALAIQREQLGADHPELANTLILLADARQAQEGARDALPLYAEALALRLRTLGETHPDTVRLHNDIGRVHEELGQFDEARRSHERALALSQDAFGLEHAEYATSLEFLARLDGKQGRVFEALTGFEQALSLHERVLGPNHPGTLRLREARAVALRKASRPRESAEELERVLALLRAQGGPEQPILISPLTELARTALVLQQPQRAQEALERALALVGPAGWSPTRRAEIQFELAQALWSSGGSRPRARTLADEALAAFTQAGTAMDSQADEVRRWRQHHAER